MTLEGTLAVDVDADGVSFEFTVRNAGPGPIELTARSGTLADVVVRADGEVVWRWSDGRAFTQALRTETLGPGDSVSHVVEWSDPPDGEYTAEATLAATEHDLADRRSFSVPE